MRRNVDVFGIYLRPLFHIVNCHCGEGSKVEATESI
jgi:hypothetical protein